MGYRTFYVHERLMTFGKRFDIVDEHDTITFTAQRKLLSIYQHTTLIDSFGETVFEIRKKLFSFKSSYFLYRDDQKVYHLFKKVINILPEIYVESLTDADAFYVQGDMIRHDYQFHKNGVNFASANKKIVSLADQYHVRIMEGYDERLVFATILIISLMKKKDK